MAQPRDSFPEPGDGGGGDGAEEDGRAAVVAGGDAAPLVEAGVGDRDAVALAVERLAGRDCLRFCFGGMQAVMPRSARAARNGLLLSPRSAISSRAGGSSGTRMFPPFWSFICPAESIMTTGRPWPAQTAASFVFSPPWGAGEAAIRCPFCGGWPRCSAP
jgi:hypothetical protein